MKVIKTSVLAVLILLVGSISASQVDQLIEINDAAESWISLNGRPLY